MFNVFGNAPSFDRDLNNQSFDSTLNLNFPDVSFGEEPMRYSFNTSLIVRNYASWSSCNSSLKQDLTDFFGQGSDQVEVFMNAVSKAVKNAFSPGDQSSVEITGKSKEGASLSIKIFKNKERNVEVVLNVSQHGKKAN